MVKGNNYRDQDLPTEALSLSDVTDKNVSNLLESTNDLLNEVATLPFGLFVA